MGDLDLAGSTYRALGRPLNPISITMGYGQRAGGTNPTGMHSGLNFISKTQYIV